MLDTSMRKWLALAGLVVVLDHLSKWWISTTMEYQETIPVFPFFFFRSRPQLWCRVQFSGGRGGLAALVFYRDRDRRDRHHRAIIKNARPRTAYGTRTGLSPWRRVGQCH